MCAHLCGGTQHLLARLLQADAQLILHQLPASQDGNVLHVAGLALTKAGGLDGNNLDGGRCNEGIQNALGSAV